MKLFGIILALIISISCTATDLYWIGTSPTWDDKNHWSLTPFGASCNCLPGPNDDVTINNLSQVQVLIDDGIHVEIKSLVITSLNELYIGNLDPATASLTINGSSSIGLSHSGLLVIRDSLIVLDAATFGININFNGSLSIKENGTVFVDGQDNSHTAIRNSGIFTIEGDGSNSGKAIVKNANITGLENFEQLTNNGIIEVNNISLNNFASGISNSSKMVNDTNGIIIIDSINVNQSGSNGIKSSGDFINKGIISITNVPRGISMSLDTFENNGTIMISNYSGWAYFISASGIFINYGTSEAFTNLESNTIGIRNSGVIHNKESGVLYFHDLGNNFGNIGIDNYNSFMNHGFINIQNIAGLGFRNLTDGHFVSDGNITIELITGDNLIIDFNFEILSGGTLDISLN